MVISQTRDRIIEAFADLQFNEEKHLYTLDRKIIPSVSKKVESHVEKVDFHAIAEFSAKKVSREEGRIVSANELRGRWNTKRDNACIKGTNTHNFMEYYDGSQKPSTPWEEAGAKFFLEMSDEYDVVFREIRMYTRKYWFAGTEDLVLVHRKTGAIITADYKTNEDLFKNYKGKTLKAPFDWMIEHPYNKYQLQLSYYQIMLEDKGLEVMDRWLVYLQEDGNYKVYNLLDLTNELREHLTIAA